MAGYAIYREALAAGKVEPVSPIGAPGNRALDLTPDGESLVFTQVHNLGYDLMLVEGFR